MPRRRLVSGLRDEQAGPRSLSIPEKYMGGVLLALWLLETAVPASVVWCGHLHD